MSVATRPTLQPPDKEVTNSIRAGGMYAALALLATAAVLHLWYPVVRSTFHIPVDYNEGWNVYHAEALGVYSSPPGWVVANYPPVWFHVLNVTGDWLGSVNMAGRLISVLSVVCVAVFCGLIVRSLTRSSAPAFLSAVLVVMLFAINARGYIGMNDPQLFAEAIMMVALLLYIRSGSSNVLLAVSAVAFMVAGFTKQTLVAFPLAVGFDLLLSSRKRLLIWTAAAAVSFVVLATLAFAVDGPHLFRHLTLGRTYSLRTGIIEYSRFVVINQVFFGIALGWSLFASRDRSKRLIAVAFGIANILGFAFMGGAGISTNLLFDSMIAMALIAGLTMAELQNVSSSVAVAALVVVAALALSFLPGSVPANVPLVIRDLASQEKEFAAAVAYLRARPLAALCEDLLLCHDAGKKFVYDPFYANELFKLGALDEEDLLRDLRSGRFKTVELDRAAVQPDNSRLRFSSAFIRTLANYYTIDHTDRWHEFYRYKGQ